VKKERDKQIFVIALAVLLVALFIISMIPDKITEETAIEAAEVKLVLENESLDLHYDGNGTVKITGKGMLCAKDLSSLLTKYDVLVTDVENIIIDDGITEIGFNTINGYQYLYSLKIGNDVEKIRNGAVKNCPNLEFVYLPAKVKKIARDFLYGTNRCYVISAGEIRDMMAASNAENAFAVENISSYNDFVRAYEDNQVVYLNFTSDKLVTTDPDAGVNPIVLHSNHIQHGPYASLSKGQYTIHLLGKDFSGLTTDAVSVLSVDMVGIIITNVVIEDDRISYDLVLSESATGVELTLNNNSESEVEIYELQIFEKITIPEVIKGWW